MCVCLSACLFLSICRSFYLSHLFIRRCCIYFHACIFHVFPSRVFHNRPCTCPPVYIYQSVFKSSPMTMRTSSVTSCLSVYTSHLILYFQPVFPFSFSVFGLSLLLSMFWHCCPAFFLHFVRKLCLYKYLCPSLPLFLSVSIESLPSTQLFLFQLATKPVLHTVLNSPRNV